MCAEASRRAPFDRSDTFSACSSQKMRHAPAPATSRAASRRASGSRTSSFCLLIRRPTRQNNPALRGAHAASFAPRARAKRRCPPDNRALGPPRRGRGRRRNQDQRRAQGVGLELVDPRAERQRRLAIRLRAERDRPRRLAVGERAPRCEGRPASSPCDSSCANGWRSSDRFTAMRYIHVNGSLRPSNRSSAP